MECIICYSNAAKQRDRCTTCKVSLCESCWLDKCRMLCPICERGALNTKRKCRVCHEDFHIKDIDSCCICGAQMCHGCNARQQHSTQTCDAVIERSMKGVDGINEAMDLVNGAFQDDSGCLSAFRDIACLPIGNLRLMFYKSNYSTLTLMLGDDQTSRDPSHFDRLATEFGMETVDFGRSVRVACKSYDMHDPATYDIFQRLPQFRQ
jgi:hypothetical protein